MLEIHQKLKACYLWLFAFCYATTTALLFTKVALPLLPSIHGGDGLLKNDAVFFQRSAITLAEGIHSHGWTSWSMWSAELNTTGNVGILSALYALLSSNDPALIIPVNAFFHASSALLLLLLGREILPGRVGNVGGLITASLFIIFPSALSWYSQPLKDGYLITGILLVLYSILKMSKPLSVKEDIKNSIWLIVGMCLVVFVKPYYIKLLLVIVTVISLMIIYWAMWTRRPNRKHIVLVCMIAIGLTVAGFKLTPINVQAGTLYESYSVDIAFSHNAKQDPILLAASKWQWESTPYLPDFIEKNFETLARTRLALVLWNLKVGANTLIDAKHLPNSVISSINYLPRALQVGLFSPFPDTWLQKISLPKLGVVAETLIWYIIAPGIFLTLLYYRSIQLTIILLFALFFIAVMSFIGPNVGTLYRARYAFEFLMILIGVVGWVGLVARKLRANGVSIKPTNPNMEMELHLRGFATPADSKKTLVRSAVVISAITLIGSLGFFVRDFLMTRWFGIGSEMDGFILGSMFPMMLVAVFSMPAGTAFIPVYTAQYNDNPELARRLLASSAFAISGLLAALAIFLYLFLPQLLYFLNQHYTITELLDIQHIANIYMLVLWVSGLVILANSVLTAIGKTIFPTLAQLVVPIITLIALAIFGTHFGVYPVAYAMLVGQVLNLAIVCYTLYRNHLLPANIIDSLAMYKHLPLREYTLLMITAMSMAAFIPVTNLMAANLQVGSVAILAMGIKVILLITGVIGIGINTVLLPYFSKLVAKFRHVQAASDFSLFLLSITLLSVPAALLLTFLVEPLVHFLFFNSKLTESDLVVLTKVIQYGIVQLPFFACGLVATKYITAYKRSGIIMISALTGLIFTILVGSVLSKLMGVAGISLAITLASALSAAILVFYTNYLKHLSIANSLFIGFNWIIFLTLFLFLHFQLYLGLIITSVIYFVFIVGEWKSLATKFSA